METRIRESNGKLDFLLAEDYSMSKVHFTFKSIYGVDYLEQQLEVRFKTTILLRKIKRPIRGSNIECSIEHDGAVRMAIALRDKIITFLKNRKLGVFVYVEKKKV